MKNDEIFDQKKIKLKFLRELNSKDVHYCCVFRPYIVANCFRRNGHVLMRFGATIPIFVEEVVENEHISSILSIFGHIWSKSPRNLEKCVQSGGRR